MAKCRVTKEQFFGVALSIAKNAGLDHLTNDIIEKTGELLGVPLPLFSWIYRQENRLGRKMYRLPTEYTPIDLSTLHAVVDEIPEDNSEPETILAQLRKTLDLDKPVTTVFRNGDKKVITKDVAQFAHDLLLEIDVRNRFEVQEKMLDSFESFSTVIKG